MFSEDSAVPTGYLMGRTSVAVLAPAKINLTLRVLGRRPDGYHLLDSVVAPIAVFDRVRISLRRCRDRGRDIRLSCLPSGAVPISDTNLVVRAARLYLERTCGSAGVDIELDKRIPVGAGLGGGSSDAAATLRLLNVLADHPVPVEILSAWALELGADVPLFLSGGMARMSGVGEVLEAVPAPLDRHSALVVAFPGVSLETRHVYAKYDDLLTTEGPVSRVPRLTVGRGPLYEWLENDLEAAAFRILPIVENLKRQLRALGAQAALMTGSGSAVFGVWDSAERAGAAVRALRADGLWARATWILDRLPAVETYDADSGRSPSW